MNSETMVAAFERIQSWKTSEKHGWTGAEVAARFEAGARGEIFSELLKFGPRLTKWPASVELMGTLEQIHVEEPVVLDFGCANGVYGELLASCDLTHQWKYIGVDINPLMIETCRTRFPQRQFEVVKDGQPLPFQDNSVDVILASGVLEFIEHTDLILKEFQRVTRSMAVLYRIPSRPVEPSAIYWQTVQHAWGNEEHSFHVFNDTELRNIIETAGFEIILREISPASGKWTPPDHPEPVQHFIYLLKKNARSVVADAGKTSACATYFSGPAHNRAEDNETQPAQLGQENDQLKAKLAENQNSLTWIESRAADLQFEVNSLRARLEESQAVRQNLESQLAQIKQGQLLTTDTEKPSFTERVSIWLHSLYR